MKHLSDSLFFASNRQVHFCTYPSKKTQKGFTLVEVFLAIFVLIMIIGISIPNLSHYLSNEALRKTTREFKILTRTAYREALTGLKPIQIQFNRRAFSIILKEKPSDVLKSVQVPNGVDYEIKYWDDNDWRIPTVNDDDQQLRWTFDPSGLCEPLEIRFRKESSWVVLIMDPLTGNPADEEYYYE